LTSPSGVDAPRRSETASTCAGARRCQIRARPDTATRIRAAPVAAEEAGQKKREPEEGETGGTSTVRCREQGREGKRKEQRSE